MSGSETDWKLAVEEEGSGRAWLLRRVTGAHGGLVLCLATDASVIVHKLYASRGV